MSITFLNMNDADFAEKLAAAFGVTAGETIEFIGPQFKRTDGRTIIAPPASVFERLDQLSPDGLTFLGLQKWDEPDANGKCLWLFPFEWFASIPTGFVVESITGKHKRFSPDMDDDHRFGALAYGVRLSAGVAI